MTDTVPTTPAVPAPAEQQQAPGTPAPAGQVPAGYVEQGRLTGALQKIQELTLSNRALIEQGNAKDATIGQLQAQLAEAGANGKATAGEQSSVIQNLTKERDDLKAQVAQFNATKSKIKLINEAGRPELYAILDSIPDAADEAAQKKIIDDLGAFAVSIATKREAQLVAGTLPGNNNPQTVAQVTPKSDKEWAVYVNALPLGSPERGKAMDQYFEWTKTPRS
jgi:hypothetical protein